MVKANKNVSKTSATNSSKVETPVVDKEGKKETKEVKKTKNVSKNASKTTSSSSKTTEKSSDVKVDGSVTPVVLSELKNEVVSETNSVVINDNVDTLLDESNQFFTKLQSLGFMISSLKSEYKTLEKKFAKEFKANQKLSKKKMKKANNRQPSGFVKPTLISQELATFLNKPYGSEMARTEVTRDINSYIRSNKLQDTTNGRIIIADEKLSTLLKLKKDDELTYFNLQRYMSPHFAKAVASTASTVTSTSNVI